MPCSRIISTSTLIIATLLSKGEGHVFLVEEPEIHMHPAYIKGLAHVLEEMIKERNIQVIAITQSPGLVTAIRDKSSIIGVRKVYKEVEIFASPKLVTETYKPYHDAEGEYLINTLAYELGLSPGYFFFLDAAILVEGESDRILLRHFIDIMRETKRLMYLPRISYDILKYRHDTLKTMLRVLHKMFRIKTFIITDNDEQGRKSAREAMEMGFQENKEVFTLSRKDMLCFIPPEIMYNTLKDIIIEVLGVSLDKLEEIEVKTNTKRNAMEILEEIKEYGMVKNNTDLLRLLIYGVSNKVPEEIMKSRGWRGRDLYHTLKPIIAKRVIKSLKEVPDEIAGILVIIDDNVREVA
ncbi:MAG: hypothetical protein B6U94_06045 [Thermofilum sp. ex4484_79]|nr:MAG: hypothetical protein B6U94_06045 [Thermofilum sp. ex4484_79]